MRSSDPFCTCVTAPVCPTQIVPNGPGWHGPEPPVPPSATKYDLPETRKIPRGLFKPEATILALTSPLAEAGGRSSAMDNVPATASSSGWNLVRRAVMTNNSLPDRSKQGPTAEPRAGQIGYVEKLSHERVSPPRRIHIGVWFVPSEEPGRRDV
jgi:hypothetical protein